MRATFILAVASSFAAVSAAPAPQTSTTASCTDKCQGYTTWMNSCASYDPSGSGWPSSCTDYCTSSSQQKAYNDCTACMQSSGLGGGDNGSLTRLCNQLVALSKIPASATAAAAKAAQESDKKNSAGANGVAAGVVAVAAVGALLF